jgi:Cu(I)/Ag(I) efflux system membrane fusion protein
MKPVSALLLVLAAFGAGWFARQSFGPAVSRSAPSAGERPVKFYQSPMHPWIKSDQPGKCTICGMDLTPVYEGDAGFATDSGLVTLGTNQLTVVQVGTRPVRRAAITRTLRVAGSIDDNDQRHRLLSAYVDGRTERLFVNQLGAEVVAGQPLATFYSPQLLTAVREYLAAHQAPGANLAEGAALRLRQMGLNEDQIRGLPANFGPTNLTVELLAPMTGTVVAKEVYEGQYVKEGDKLFELADFSSMWFVFDAYERDLEWLRVGQPVEITAPSLPGRRFTNAISFIDPNLRGETRSAKIRVELANPQVDEPGGPRRLIRHRVFADGQVRAATEPVLTVPRSAVLSPGTQAVVYVERGNGAYEQRAVTLGRAGDEIWEVVSGLSEGDSVVTSGNLLLDSQAQLHAAGAPPAPASSPSAMTVPLTPEQQTAVLEFLQQTDGLRDALAADDLAKFNSLAPQVHAAQPKLSAALKGAAGWAEPLEKLAAVSHLDAARDLPGARQAFHRLSAEVVEMAKRVRAAARIPDLRIFQCPMTKKSFPGAPPRADWLQFSPAIRNPYFGAEMLDCGTEVKP